VGRKRVVCAEFIYQFADVKGGEPAAARRLAHYFELQVHMANSAERPGFAGLFAGLIAAHAGKYPLKRLIRRAV
jgi:hypothetical protein